MKYDLKDLEQVIYFINEDDQWVTGTINDIKITLNGIIYHIVYETPEGINFINLSDKDIFNNISEIDHKDCKFFILPNDYKDTTSYSVYKIDKVVASIIRIQGETSCFDIGGEHIGSIDAKYFMDNNFDIKDYTAKIDKRMIDFNKHIKNYSKYIIPKVGARANHRIIYKSDFDEIILHVEPNIKNSFPNISKSVNANTSMNKSIYITKSEKGDYAFTDNYLVLNNNDGLPKTISMFGVEWDYELEEVKMDIVFPNTKVFPDYTFYKIIKISVKSENIIENQVPRIYNSVVSDSKNQGESDGKYKVFRVR